MVKDIGLIGCERYPVLSILVRRTREMRSRIRRALNFSSRLVSSLAKQRLLSGRFNFRKLSLARRNDGPKAADSSHMAPTLTARGALAKESVAGNGGD